MFYKELTALLLMVLLTSESSAQYVEIYNKMMDQVNYIKTQQCLRITGKECNLTEQAT